MKMYRFAALAMLALGGCISSAPMTPGEFRQAVRGGAFMARTHMVVVPQPFEAVIANLRKQAMTCLASRHFSSVMSGLDMSTSVIIYHPVLRLTGPRAAELTLQMGPPAAVVKQPPDGVFIMVVDIEPAGAPGETRLTVYGRATSREETLADESLPTWARGSAAGCPLK